MLIVQMQTLQVAAQLTTRCMLFPLTLQKFTELELMEHKFKFYKPLLLKDQMELVQLVLLILQV